MRRLARRLGWDPAERLALWEALRAMEPAQRAATLREVERAAEPAADGEAPWTWAVAARLRRWASKEGYGDLAGGRSWGPEASDDPPGLAPLPPSDDADAELLEPPLDTWQALLAHYASEPEPGEVEDLLVGWMDAGFLDPLALGDSLLDHLTLLHLRDPGVRL